MADKLVDEESLKEALTNVKTYVDNNSGGTSYSSFSEASVDEIKEVIEKGLYRTVYHIGDTRKITLSDGYTYTARILDFDTYYQSGSLEKTHILLGLDQLLNQTYSFNSTNTNSGGWKDSLLRTNLESLYQDNASSDIISLCLSATIYDPTYDGEYKGYQSSDCHFFIPAMVEIYGGSSIWNASLEDPSQYASGYAAVGHQFKYYQDLLGHDDKAINVEAGNTDLRKYRNGYTSSYWYWLRDASLSNSAGFWGVYDGGYLGYNIASASGGVFVCWCI